MLKIILNRDEESAECKVLACMWQAQIQSSTPHTLNTTRSNP